MIKIKERKNGKKKLKIQRGKKEMKEIKKKSWIEKICNEK